MGLERACVLVGHEDLAISLYLSSFRLRGNDLGSE